MINLRIVILALLFTSFTFGLDRGKFTLGSNKYPHSNTYEQNGGSEATNSQTSIEKHSFHSPFLFGASSNIPFWEYGGSAVATENFIRLVPAIRSRVGYIWNTEPVDIADWQVDIEFNIHNTYSPGADGMAFWYAKENLKSGSLFGNIEEFDGLGVIFDTYDNNANGDNPAIIAIAGHGHHVNWDYENDLKGNQLERCRADFRNALSGIVKSRIQYKNQVLTVWIDTLGSGEFTKCLTVNNLFLPKGYYFGVSAATGGLADYHDIYGFVTKDISSGSTEHAPEKDKENEHYRHKKHGWYDPYEYYHKQVQEENEKRKQEAQQYTTSAPDEPRWSPPTHSEQPIPDQPPTFGMADEEEHKFFENLREKLKHFGFDDEEKKNENQETKSPGVTAPPVDDNNVNFSTQTGLLILEALEEIARTVRSTSTKNDIANIIDRVKNVAGKQSQVQQNMQEMKDHLSNEVHTMLAGLKAQTSQLQREIKRLDTVLHGINVQVDDLGTKQQVLGRHLESQLPQVREVVRKSSSFGFWTFFVFFQVVFIIAAIYWKKYRDVKSQKIF